MANQVPDDEEVVREPHVRDDTELVLESRHDLVAQVLAVALVRAAQHQVAQESVRPLFVRVATEDLGYRELRQRVVVELDGDVRAFGDRECVVTGFGEVTKDVAHLRSRLQVVLVTVEAEPVRVRDQ